MAPDSTILLETADIAVTVSIIGARVTAIRDKRRRKEWLWSCEPASSGGGFDDRWSGGMDVIFPTDEPSPQYGGLHRDHGIAWDARWELAEYAAGGPEPHGRLALVRDGLFLTCEFRVRGAAVCLTMDIRSERDKDFPYVFRWHPAFALSAPLRLLIPAGKCVCDKSFGKPLPASTEFHWPLLPLKPDALDLDHTSRYPEGQTALLYLRLREGCFSLVDDRAEAAICFTFDKAAFPYLVYFLSNGGWRSHRVLAVEPSTAMYTRLEESREHGQVRFLRCGARERFQLQILLTGGDMR